jgi:hypothetical protein
VIGLECAERSLKVSRAFLNACLQAANVDEVLGGWATIRRGRFRGMEPGGFEPRRIAAARVPNPRD